MLTTQQAATLAADIAADPAFAGLPQNSDGAFAIAAAYNAEAEPAWVIWRSSVAQDEIMQNGFDWTLVDNLGVGRARIWEWMFDNAERTFNPSKPNVRAGIDACWAGAGAAFIAMRAAIYVHCKRNATRAEKLFSTGVGTSGSPATAQFEDQLTYSDVQQAMGW